MRVRFTVTPANRTAVYDRLVQGRWYREAGVNPARTRHCDRGSRPHDATEGSATREGAAGRPGSQETSSDRKPIRPRGKGWLHVSTFPRPPGRRRCSSRRPRRRPRAAGPATVTVRVEGDAETLVPRTALTTTTAPVSKDGDASHSCTGTSAAGALEQASGGDWIGHLRHRLRRLRRRAHQGRAAHVQRPRVLGLLRQRRAGQRRRLQHRAERRRQRAVRRRRRSDGSPIGLLDVSGVPRTVAPGTPFTVTVTRTTTTYDASFNPSPRASPAAGVSVGGATTAATAPRGSP